MNKRHQLFADTYLSNGMNARQAYFAVYGEKTNKDPTYCYDLLRRPDVKEYIEQKRKETYEALNIDALRVMEEIAKIAFGEPGKDLPLNSKIKALDLLSRNLSLQTVKTENKDTIEVQLVEE